MSMIELNLIQGTQEWLDARLRAFNASEAPVMMGCHPNMTRDELLESKATCNPKQYSDFVEKRVFAKGHETEAKARPILEAKIGDDLFPVSGKNGKLRASFDGLTMMQGVGFEHKQWNAELAERVRRQDPPPYIYWQLEHQLAVCPSLERIILVVSDGTEDNWVQMDYTAVPGRREQLLAGWERFEKDLAEFRPTTKTVEPVGVRPDSLPALFVDVAGQLTTSSNLDDFRRGAEQLIGSIKTELETDEDFANAEAAIKWLEETEKNIDLVIQQSLSKTGPLDALVRTLKDVQQNLARATRLKLNKQVEAQKTNRRNKIVSTAESTFGTFLDGVNAEFPKGVFIGNVKPDFYLAIKSKRSFDAMVSACNDTIAKAKIQVNEIAAAYRRNLAILAEHKDHDFLFPNKQQFVTMDHDHLRLTITSRIDAYKAEQQKTEAARIQNHHNTIAGIQAAGDFDDTVPYEALVVTRKRVESIDTSALEEFAIKADQAKTTTLARLNARITKLREEAERAEQLEQERVRLAEAQKPAESPRSVAVDQQDDLLETPTIHAAEQANPTQQAAVRRRPGDLEIVDVLANHYRANRVTVIAWLEDLDTQALADRLEAA